MGKAKGKPRSKSAKKRKVAKVMQEFKEGKLTSSSGQRVTSREQAVAIAMSESGQERKKPKKRKRRRKAG